MVELREYLRRRVQSVLRNRNGVDRLARRQGLFVADRCPDLDFEPVLRAVEYLAEVEVCREQPAGADEDGLLDRRTYRVAGRRRVVQRERELIGLAARWRAVGAELALVSKRRALGYGDRARFRRKHFQHHRENKDPHALLLHVQHASNPAKKTSSRPVAAFADQNPA